MPVAKLPAATPSLNRNGDKSVGAVHARCRATGRHPPAPQGHAFDPASASSTRSAHVRRASEPRATPFRSPAKAPE
ncbi:hypothetical protein ACU4GD_35630 [Cupriavidus basilensis]